MAKISSLLDMGRRGMMLSQTALNTTSHNIANKSTEGYSRQRADIVTNPAIDEGRYRSGTGAQLGGINRVNNPWLEKQIEQEGSTFSFLDSKANALGGLENVINEQNVDGINASISKFFNSFRDLANNPESAVPRTQVREAAQSLIGQLQSAKKQIDGAAGGVAKSIQAGLDEVNVYGKEIAQLNEKIVNVEITGASANDERDRRDLLVKKLSEKMNITYAEDPQTGMVNITAGKTAVLVAGTTSTRIYTTPSESEGPRVMYDLSKGGTAFDVTDQFTGGSLGASLGVVGPKGEISQLGQHLEHMAYNIANEVNKVHQEGYDRYNGMGVQFFDMSHPAGFSIETMSLNKEIMKDVGLIAAASQPNSPGDNNVAQVLQNLQFQKVMGDGQYTFDNFYNSKVGEIGLATKGVNTSLESQRSTLDQLKNTRESISGVNLDEEASKMIEFQKSFEASARMIRVADEMFDTVLNLKRM